METLVTGVSRLVTIRDPPLRRADGDSTSLVAGIMSIVLPYL